MVLHKFFKLPNLPSFLFNSHYSYYSYNSYYTYPPYKQT